MAQILDLSQVLEAPIPDEAALFLPSYIPYSPLDDELAAELADARAAWWATFRDPQAHAVDLEAAARTWQRVRVTMAPS